MFSRRRLPLAVAAAGACLLVSAAAAAPEDTFTATLTPSHVKPSTSAAYTMTLTTSTGASTLADRATIAIPDGFTVGSVTANTTAGSSGNCAPSAWTPNVNDERIRLDDPSGGGKADHLCPGAKLTVAFQATSPATEGSFPWNPALEEQEEEVDFTLIGPAPTVTVEKAPPLDSTAPVVTISQKPLDPSHSRSATFAFSADEPSSFACELDGGGFQPCTSPANYDALGDGVHNFAVRATDLAGNTGGAAHSWSIATGAPTAAIASGPPPLTNSRSATFTFSADEPSSFACELDGGGFQPCTSPASYDGLGDGAHTFAVRPTDAVGNTGAASSHSWAIDATAPDTTLGSAPRSGTTTLSATFVFSASEPGSFECKLDTAAFAPCTSPRSYTGLRRGAHSFEVQAIDAAGNLELAAALHRWTIAAPKRAKATSALFAPRAGARITSPPLLAWRRAARATYYNVQLFRGGVKVLSAWPVRTRLQLRSRWTYLGRQRTLTAGSYRWYVWPGYGRAAANRYGRMLGQSTFTFVAPGGR